MPHNNTRFLMLLGIGEGTLYVASEALGLTDPSTVVFVWNITDGAVQLGPKDTDPTSCVILTRSKGRRESWALIDYRQPVPTKELARRKTELSEKLPAPIRKLIKVDSTQDLTFRDSALR